MADHEQRVRERAYHLWEDDGRPEGRELEFWERARFLVGLEENPDAAQLPNPIVADAAKGYTSPPPPEPVEPIEALENQGEFPDRFADQGEKSAGPVRRAKAPSVKATGSETGGDRGDKGKNETKGKSSGKGKGGKSKPGAAPPP